MILKNVSNASLAQLCYYLNLLRYVYLFVYKMRKNSSTLSIVVWRFWSHFSEENVSSNDYIFHFCDAHKYLAMFVSLLSQPHKVNFLLIFYIGRYTPTWDVHNLVFASILVTDWFRSSFKPFRRSSSWMRLGGLWSSGCTRARGSCGTWPSSGWRNLQEMRCQLVLSPDPDWP